MPLEQKPLRPIQIDYRCDECGGGYYRPTGVMLPIYPPRFTHVCSNCYKNKNFNEQFPSIRYAAEGDFLDIDEILKEIQ